MMETDPLKVIALGQARILLADVTAERDQLRAELEQLRALVAPVAQGWLAERSHVVGPTHELRDALNALAAGWTS